MSDVKVGPIQQPGNTWEDYTRPNEYGLKLFTIYHFIKWPYKGAASDVTIANDSEVKDGTCECLLLFEPMD